MAPTTPHLWTKYLHLWLVAEMPRPAVLTVAVIRLLAITINTAWVSHALPAVLPLVPQPAPALPGLEAGTKLFAAVRYAHRLVAEDPCPTLVTDAL